jgi:hypothetical protein
LAPAGKKLVPNEHSSLLRFTVSDDKKSFIPSAQLLLATVGSSSFFWLKKKFGAEMFGMFNPMSAVTSKSKKIWKIWIPPNPKIMSKPPLFGDLCITDFFI